MASLMLTGVLMGLGGTLAMDIWAWFLARFDVAPKPNWAMPGRWFGHVMRGRIFHDNIGAAETVAGELRLGWALHYGVGILYGVIFVILAGGAWVAEPRFLPLWGFSLLTIAAGWLLMHPGMGMGWFVSKAEHPWKTRFMGLVAHTAFALGMWAVALV